MNVKEKLALREAQLVDAARELGFARAEVGRLRAELAEAWRDGAHRHDEGRRYYIAWQVARMRAAAWRRTAVR